ncbi:glycine cleavage system protein GcvH [Desulfosporosinus sp. FKB]|uniref:glycine cleavage system protein H n=1 Tax=Desulfosporosinus sp. FKB TaxID=1969835 RepID=UPI000B4983F9|nr:glycine cleavage system protein GcvH [Desulfosporosinus sp. FKB]
MDLEYAIPENLYYDTHDFWIKVNGEEAVIGLSDYGQSNTGDILYLELLQAGETVGRGDKLGSVESGKWVGSLLAPLSGTILESNKDVLVHPRKVNTDAYGDGWMCRIKLRDSVEVKGLLTAQAYRKWIIEQETKEEEIG